LIFNTWEFGVFAVIVLTLYWFVIPRAFRPAFLLVAGAVFYAAAIPVYLLLIVALAAVTFVCARGILAAGGDPKRRRAWVVVGITASVGVLVFFKYTKLFAGTFAALCHGGCTRPVPDIIVPLAVSFFTFEFVHLLVDVWNGKIRKVTLRDFALFTMFFPSMVAGPIKRYQNFVPQIDRVERLSGVVTAAGIARVIAGLAKKSIVADSMDAFTQPLLHPSALFSTGDYWIAMLAYTAKIYFDFTGYSDMAIGMAALLGFQILENFDRPYRAADISQFWRRWHISLSSWIRDYLFIPLGGSRAGGVRNAVNLAFVMALAGLWHGAAWHFVLWGLWHGAGLAVHRVWARLAAVPRDLVRTRPYAFAATAVTFLFVAFGWVLFASPTIGAAVDVYRGLAGFASMVAALR
jgi:alginate O-acetyltransferase complex protein AlgI